MEKVLQILAVFGLLMLLIWRSIRGKEERFRRFSYLTKLRPPLMEGIRGRLIVGVMSGGEWGSGEYREERMGGGSGGRRTGRESGDEGVGGEDGGERMSSERGAGRMRGTEEVGGVAEADDYLIDEDSGLMLCYRMEGKLTVYRRGEGRVRELQELSVPMDCTGMAWDPLERKIYLEEGGDFFVYGPEE